MQANCLDDRCTFGIHREELLLTMANIPQGYLLATHAERWLIASFMRCLETQGIFVSNAGTLWSITNFTRCFTCAACCRDEVPLTMANIPQGYLLAAHTKRWFIVDFTRCRFTRCLYSRFCFCELKLHHGYTIKISHIKSFLEGLGPFFSKKDPNAPLCKPHRHGVFMATLWKTPISKVFWRF